MKYEEFTKHCEKAVCLRHTIYNEKTCKRDSKRARCFQKYNDKLSKKKIKQEDKDVEYEDLIKEVWLRDTGQTVPKIKSIQHWEKYCRFWKCLTPKERVEFYRLHKGNLHICRNLDVAHIKGKGSNPEEKFNINNVVLLNRLTHSLLDSYIDPLTLKPINAEERQKWWERISYYE